MKTDKFRWCFIGTGRLADQVAKQITGSGNHEITVCFSRNQETCRDFAQRYGARSCESSEEVLHSGGFDGVYVVTPHNAHFRYVKQALEAGKPVLCEKSFTVTADEAMRKIISFSIRSMATKEAGAVRSLSGWPSSLYISYGKSRKRTGTAVRNEHHK